MIGMKHQQQLQDMLAELRAKSEWEEAMDA